MKKLIVLVLALTTMMAITAYAADDSYFKPGDYNANVIALHEKLSDLGYYTLRPESPFGRDSIYALNVLQENLGWEESQEVTESQLEQILSLDHVVGKNLLARYHDALESSNYRTDETLDGDIILHFDYRDSDSDDHVNVALFGSVIEPVPGKEYTLSFMAKGSGIIHTYFYPSTVASGYSNKNGKTTAVDGHIATELDDDWSEYIFTWRTKSDVEGIKNVLPIRVFKGSEVWVSKIKFECGNQATEFASPEE